MTIFLQEAQRQSIYETYKMCVGEKGTVISEYHRGESSLQVTPDGGKFHKHWELSNLNAKIPKQ